HIWMWFAPVIDFCVAIFVIRYNNQERDGAAFLASMASLLGAVLTVGFTIFPDIMVSNIGDNMYSRTVYNSSSSQTS
ncbi:cytochrome d ubiquinol oxidase subunit II, partial [Francisella tularensis subsp. holarctica]|nr:cytochrome d ubiquinol oxidase subunit II [Francisella tularensis subsp. holarctica]